MERWKPMAFIQFLLLQLNHTWRYRTVVLGGEKFIRMQWGHSFFFLALPLGSEVPLISEIFVIAGISSLLILPQTKRGFIPVSTLPAEQKD